MFTYETERIGIRALEEPDANSIFNFYNDRELLGNFLNPNQVIKPRTKDDVFEYIKELRASTEEVPLCIVEKNTDSIDH